MADDHIVELVQTKIYSIRGQKVMLDADIAEIYGVETKRINEAVRNNPDKFPEDFLFELVSLSSTFIAKFLTLKDTEDSQSPPASLTQTALQNEPLLLANQFRLD